MTYLKPGVFDSLEVSREALAVILRLVPNSISRLADQAGLPRTSRGLYPLAECLQWHLARLESRTLERPGDIVDERRKLVVSQREAQELENASKRAAMLSAPLVASVLHQIDTLIGARLAELPKLGTALSKLTDQTAINRALQDAARECRRKASEDVAKFAADLADGPPTA